LALIAVILGLAYGSLTANILGQWVPVANSPMGILLFATATGLLIVMWLWAGVMR
jgi:hypothetical protein